MDASGLEFRDEDSYITSDQVIVQTSETGLLDYQNDDLNIRIVMAWMPYNSGGMLIRSE